MGLARRHDDDAFCLKCRNMNLGVTAFSSRRRNVTAGRGAEIRGGGRARSAALALATLILGAVAARAQTPPPGMVPYDHPVYHNGKRVLWHGVEKGEPSDPAKTNAPAAKAEAHPPADAQAESTQAAKADRPIAKVSPSYEFTVFSDGDDACAFRLATDIVAALKTAGVRARPTVGRTAARFLAKLAGNDAADFVIAPVDALVDDPKGPWKDKAPYVTRLAVERIEIVAGKNVSQIADLENRKVAIGIADSADEAVATALFGRLGVKPTLVRESLVDSLNDLAYGKVDAVVATGEGGSKTLADFGKDGRFHLVAAPMTSALAPFYSPLPITSQDRPHLVAAGAKVDSLAAPMALIAIDAGQGSARATRDAPFVAALFDTFSALVSPTADPSWRDVNIAATLDWPRLGAAQDWIDQQRHGSVDAAFDEFRSLAHVASQSDGGPDGPDAAKLFQSLMQVRSAAR